MANSRQPILASYTQSPVDQPWLVRWGLVAARVAVAAVYGGLVVTLPPQLLFTLAIPIVAMLLVTLWMLPDRGTFPLGAIEVVFPVYFVLSIAWPVYLAVGLPGLPWLTPTRMVLFILTFLVGYSVSTSAVLRQHMARVARGSPFFWACFLTWEVTQVITIPMSQLMGTSLKQMINNQVELVGIFFLGCLLFTRKGWATWLVGALIILAIASSINGFVELRLGYPPWANHIPSFLRVDEGLMNNVLGSQARFSDGLYRVHGQFPNSLLLAEFLAMTLPFILHYIFMGSSFVRRVLMLGVFILVIAAILISQSRLGLIGALITSGVYPLLWAVRTWRSGRGGMFGPVVLLGAPVAALMLLGVILSSHSLTTRVFGGGAQSASDEARRVQREMAVPRVVRNPIGYGLGSSGRVLGFTNPGGYLTIDNGLITTVLDLGVVGLIAFLGMLVTTVRKGVEVFLRTTDPEIGLAGPAAVTIIVFIVVRSVLSQENNYPLAFLVISMVMALMARERRASLAAPAIPTPYGATGRAAAAANMVRIDG